MLRTSYTGGPGIGRVASAGAAGKQAQRGHLEKGRLGAGFRVPVDASISSRRAAHSSVGYAGWRPGSLQNLGVSYWSGARDAHACDWATEFQCPPDAQAYEA